CEAARSVATTAPVTRSGADHLPEAVAAGDAATREPALRGCRFAGRRALSRPFHFLGVGSVTSGAVQFGAVIEGFLRGSNVAGITLPGFEHGFLQCPPVREAELPGMIAQGVHGVQMLGGLLGALSTREEDDPRDR